MTHTKLIVTVLATILMLASCASKKNTLSYFDNIGDAPNGVLGDVQNYELRIKPDDELVIIVNSEQPEATAQYNLPMANPALSESLTSSSTPTQQTYIVNQKGDINMAGVGRIHVAGMTTGELAAYIDGVVSRDVKDAVVKVSLANFAVNVLGEVHNPRIITVNTERFSVLDALAACGDMTEYGQRENVIVIREQDGKRVYQRLNLHDKGIAETPFFYLQQNDVVYVEPNIIRSDNSKYNTNSGFKLSVISTVVSSVSVIASLIIALSR